MTKKRILTVSLAILAVFALMFVSGLFGTAYANAESEEPVTTVSEEDGNEITTRGLVTQISLSIGADNCEVWAEAHNDFTLGFSTIQVYIELFSSDTYQENYRYMKLERYNHTADLNIGETLRTAAPINGVKRYWMARMRYKFDNRDWVEETTKTCLIDVDGYLVG